MFEAIPSPYLAPFDGKFRIKDYSTASPKDGLSKHECKKRLQELSVSLSDLQRVLYAQSEYSLLLIFQAIDAAGHRFADRRGDKWFDIGAILRQVVDAVLYVGNTKYAGCCHVVLQFMLVMLTGRAIR